MSNFSAGSGWCRSSRAPWPLARRVGAALGGPHARHCYLAPIGQFTALSLLVRPIPIPRILPPVAVPLALLAAGVQAVPGRRARLGAGSRSARAAARYAVWVQAQCRLYGGLAPGLAPRAGFRTRRRHSPGRGVPHPSGRQPGARASPWALLLRYDDTGRLGALPRVNARRVAMAAGVRSSRAWTGAPRRHGRPRQLDLTIGRAGAMPARLRPWADARLEPGPREEFDGVLVEQGRLRP